MADSKTRQANDAGASGGPRTELSRDLGTFDITMIGVGAMIGAGIFVLIGIAAGEAGPALILTFALNGVVAILTAMVYAELGSAIPEAGGGYLWIKEGLPGGNAFIAGWMSWFAHAVAGSLYALGFGAYFKMVLEGFGAPLPDLPFDAIERGFGALIACVFVFINFRGVSHAGIAGNIVTLGKVLILAVFIAVGGFVIAGHPHYMNHFQPIAPKGFGGVLIAMGLTFIAFEGYEIIVQAGEEVKNPRVAVPKAVFLSLAIVLPIYLLVAFVAIGAVEPADGTPTWQWLGNHKELGLVEAARSLMPGGGWLLLVGGLLSTMSALNATTFSSTRVAFAMGRDRNLPERFARVYGKTGTPAIALLASGAIVIAMAVAVPIEDVAAAADVMFLLLFLQVNIAAITIRRKYGDKLKYGFVVPFFPVIPIVAIVCNLGLAVFMFIYSPLAGCLALGWLGVGWVLWRWYAKPREREKKATPVVGIEALREEKQSYRVVAAVANETTADGLGRFAGRLAAIERGEAIILHAIVLPRQLPSSAALPMSDEARNLIQKARRDIPAPAQCSSLLRVAHVRPWRAVVDTLEEYDADAVVLGWTGWSHGAKAELGRNIDRILSRANCDVFVLQQASAKPATRVLAAVSQEQEARLILLAARMLVRGHHDDRIDILHVATDDGDDITDKLDKLADQACETDPEGPSVHVIRPDGRGVIAEIAKRCGDYDRLVVGVQPASWWRKRIFGRTLTRIVRAVDCPVCVVSPGPGELKHSVQEFFEFFRELQAKADEEAEEAQEKPPDDDADDIDVRDADETDDHSPDEPDDEKEREDVS